MDGINSFYLDKIYFESNNINYIKNLKDYITRLDNNNVPVIFDYIHLSKLTNSSVKYFQSIVVRKRDFYKIFSINKKTGGKRTIAVPEDSLRKLQKWIYLNILLNVKSSNYAQAYIRGIPLKSNAVKHVYSRYLLKIDLKNFFENISEMKVYHIFEKLGYLPNIAFLLTRICTFPLEKMERNKYRKWSIENQYDYKDNRYVKCNEGEEKNIIGCLLQGAITSPYLSNLCFKETDEKIGKLCEKEGFSYTRYYDDIFVSSRNCNRQNIEMLRDKILEILKHDGYIINKKKTRIIGQGGKKKITGIIVDNDIYVGKDMIKKAKNYIYYAKKYGIADECKKLNEIKNLNIKTPFDFKHRLFGLINYIKQIEPIKGQKLQEEARSLDWPKI